MVRKLLFLLCLCFAVSGAYAAITATGSDGVYTLTVGSGTATTDWDGLSTDVKAATSITIVTADSYELTADDMTKICGDGQGNNTIFTALANLSLEKAALANDGVDSSNDLLKLNKLTTLSVITFPNTSTVIPTQCLLNNTTVTEIIIPNNDANKGQLTLSSQCFASMTALKKMTVGNIVGTFGNQACLSTTSLETIEFEPGVTTIGAEAFHGCTGVKNIVLPESVTSIESQAFEATNIESIRLPNTLKTIGTLAFDGCTKLKSITIPASVENIASHAFQATSSLTDVYVLGANTKCENKAFEEQTDYKYALAATADREGETINKSWFVNQNAAYPVTVLHYPEAAKDYYVNKVYTTAKYNQANWGSIIYWSANIGTDDDPNWWPNANASQSPISFIIQYFEHPEYVLDTDNTTILNNSDYYGWNNFMFTMDDVNDHIWPETRITEDRWYSMVLPFDMTKDQYEGAFGAGTEICEFTKVTTTTVDNKETITLYFSTDVEATVAHHPYMIHPKVKTTAKDADGNIIGNLISGIDVAAATATEGTASMIEVVKDDYTFIGSYTATADKLIPYGYYYLGGGDGTYKLGFYRMMNSSTDTSRKGGHWTKYSAIVKPSTSGNTAKFMNAGFGFDSDNETTDIKIVAGSDKMNADKTAAANLNKVYNMQGQLVSEGAGSLNGLAKGMYILNGKKYIVK